MGCSGGPGRVRHGVTCLMSTASGRPSTCDTGAGPRMVPGPGSSMSCVVAVTRPRVRSGRWRWIPRLPGHISTPLVRRARRRPLPTQGALSNYNIPPDGHDREALGRSRGGLTTKVHLAADRRCRPVARVITSGRRHDSVAFDAVLAGVRIRRRGRGRARTRRAECWPIRRTPTGRSVARCASAASPRPSLNRPTSKPTGPDVVAVAADRRPSTRRGTSKRNVVERCIHKLKQYRAIATRYDKREYMYQGTVDLASVRIWLRDPVP
jgi:transposase